MKISSQQVGSGKLGNAIYSEVGGVCVARAYRSSISNPSTPAQVEQRAKMKLITQVGATMAPIIAIPKSGLVSARNKFTSKNFGLTSYSNNAAEINLNGIQITDGHSSLPALTVNNVSGTGLAVQLSAGADAAISRVVYAVYAINSQGEMVLVGSQVVETPGNNRIFAANFAYQSGNYIIYAYGMRDMNSAATAKFANLGINNASTIAKLVATRTISTSDYQFTKTISYTNIGQGGGGGGSDEPGEGD
jgi:hypothetical protein